MRAGRLHLELDGIDAWAVRFGGLEIARRIYPAVRDAWWGTVAPVVSGLEVETTQTTFSAHFSALHQTDSVDFAWEGAIVGTTEGVVEYEMTGRAQRAFRCARIGLCVLHPREQAGRRYRAMSPDGPIEGVLPVLVGPQRVEDGMLRPLFASYRALEIDLAPHHAATFSFEGDLFEMEDQRNWSDASFKTYSTPLALGVPREFQEGQTVHQRVRIELTGSGRTTVPPSVADSPIRIELRASSGQKLPPLGVCLPADGPPLAAAELELLRGVRLNHLRLDLDLASDWRKMLARGVAAARFIDTELELAVALGGRSAAARIALNALASALAEAGVGAAPVPDGALGDAASTIKETGLPVRVARVLLVGGKEAVSGREDVEVVRQALRGVLSAVPFAGGTNLWFAQLNTHPPDLGGLDGLCYSTAATVHASDDRSVMETPVGQGDTVRAARALAPGREVFVGPVSLRPRTWPAGRLAGEAALPFSVDTRQPSLLAAAWTVASLAHLAEAGASAITCFEAAGWRGVLPRLVSSAEQEAFSSSFGTVFPSFHVLADWDDLRRGGPRAETSCSQPYVVKALLVLTATGTSGLIANLTPKRRRVRLVGFREGWANVRTLDSQSLSEALERPATYRQRHFARRRVARGGLILELGPYAVMRVDPAQPVD